VFSSIIVKGEKLEGIGRLLWLGALGILIAAPVVRAASPGPAYPSRPIRMVLPFPPGGSTDVMARGLSQKLTEALGKQVVIDNRAGGAGGIIGTDLVAKATPDGHIVLFTTSITHTAGPSLYSQLPYDPVQDFAPVTMVASAPLMIVVNPGVPARTLKEFVAYAKSNPGKVNYASGGIGASTHLPAELFKSMAGVDMVHVPFKGGGPALLGVISGQAQMLMISVVGALPHVKSGKLRGLALTSKNRSPEFPGVPTVAESGVPGYEVVLWYGLYAPRGTPGRIVSVLQRVVAKTIQTPEIRQRLAQDGAHPVGNTPEQFSEINRAEVEKWAKVIKGAGIKAE
jgi:tripartite-type tricarboxylate transporter receptor subunit TctC